MRRPSETEVRMRMQKRGEEKKGGRGKDSLMANHQKGGRGRERKGGHRGRRKGREGEGRRDLRRATRRCP